MKIINKVDNANCRQWVGELTKQAIQNSRLVCTEVVIEEFDFSDRIFLKINEADFTIRIWDIHLLDSDKEAHIFRAIVSYTLFIMIKEDDGSGHGEVIDHNSLTIVWRN